ncbi:CDP-glucose 4,6-dehydratase [Cupriavidus sp. 2TAF22]|uniref:CDP-glucose 4,6-dehydratase n=1 Tax=unclassified Cupriavidus TaxID=2640874 RepID=UPI003F907438
MEIAQFGHLYQGRRVLLTGHTGFKGSWLAQWLTGLGAELTCYALPPQAGHSHWDLLQVSAADVRGDIRDMAALDSAFAACRPEIVFHLAAQPLVRRSYSDPLETWSTNVMGTANVLEACRRHAGVRAVVLVTTDKVYANREWEWGYRENDPLGGHDPYAASKAATELLAASYRQSFLGATDTLLATARAGNVIGGGDWSADRLIPDLVRALAQGNPLEIRSPRSTRPWQHVLDCLSGYLLLGQRLLEGDAACAAAWNFGPAAEGNCCVESVLGRLKAHWPELAWRVASQPQPHESGLLALDWSKARARLGWTPVWQLDEALGATAAWYRQFQARGTAATRSQLAAYVEQAACAGLVWAAA